MKFLRREGETLVFEVDPRELETCAIVLGRYPVLPVEHHQVHHPTQAGTPVAEDQALLEDAMRETHAANRRRLQTFLREQRQLITAAGTARSMELPLTVECTEWLLEVLNNLRVGCWVRLGKPGWQQRPAPQLTRENATDYGTMEFAGHLQTILLQGLGF